MQFSLEQNEEGRKEVDLTDASHITYCMSRKTLEGISIPK